MPPVKDACSPNSSGGKQPKPTPLPHPDKDSRGVKHAAIYGDRRTDQANQPPIGSLPSSSAPRGPGRG
jgi:hypothetical protein